jgi:hypothetical protein
MNDAPSRDLALVDQLRAMPVFDFRIEHALEKARVALGTYQ